MRKILLIGAGRSSSWLIRYLLEHAQREDWHVTVGDVSLQAAASRTKNSERTSAIAFDSNNETQRAKEIGNVDLVISMLPAHMHTLVAEECVRQKKHLATASYVSKEMQQLHVPAVKAGITLLNECGLDPGIDHMSAMKIMDDARAAGKEILSFRSYCGGLLAPESNDNPWGYKFSWNPRNVVLAGQGTARYIEDGKYRYLPYHRLFSETETITVDGLGIFDGYANRDSLSYRTMYRLEKIPTMIRGTLRQSGFCKAWNAFVQMGYTDDSYAVADSISLTYSQLTDSLLPPGRDVPARKIARLLNTSEDAAEIKMIEWTGIFSQKAIGLENATPAMALQKLLEEKWKLNPDDRDMIVMQHIFEFSGHGKSERVKSDLLVKGDDSTYTAMARTVGLPLAIACRLILNGTVKSKGVLVPVTKEIYEPVLKELESFGIKFRES